MILRLKTKKEYEKHNTHIDDEIKSIISTIVDMNNTMCRDKNTGDLKINNLNHFIKSNLRLRIFINSIELIFLNFANYNNNEKLKKQLSQHIDQLIDTTENISLILFESSLQDNKSYTNLSEKLINLNLSRLKYLRKQLNA